MSIAAKTIIAAVQHVLNDSAGDRAPASALVPMMNKAQRDIMAVRPDTTASVSTWALAAGSKQALPSTAYSLIDITSNSTGSKARITKVPMTLLDAQEPGWRSRASSATIQHFMHDLRTPRVLWVYPPALVGAQVELEASNYPTDIAEPASPGQTASTVTGNISLNDEWESALFCLTAHYAYLSDLEGVNNPALAAGYMQRASSILGVQIQSTAASAPKN